MKTISLVLWLGAGSLAAQTAPKKVTPVPRVTGPIPVTAEGGHYLLTRHYRADYILHIKRTLLESCIVICRYQFRDRWAGTGCCSAGSQRPAVSQ